MPPRIALLGLVLGASLTCAQLPVLRAAEPAAHEPAAAANNSYRLFYDKLGQNGEWIQTDNYGYVFQPKVASTDKTWRPYTDGYWAQTDDGWAWVSNEDFGWACYHYGRWANLVDAGWVWVPGSEWAPGFVSWRVSKDHQHVGWAPLPPEAQVTEGEAVESWVDSAYDIGPDAYTFIACSDFGADSYRTHLIPADQNATLIVETENVTRINYQSVGGRNLIFNGGPDVAIFRGIGRPVRSLRLETRPGDVEFFEHGDQGSISEVQGGRLVVAIAAPNVITSTSIRVSEPAHIERRLTSVTVDRGYRGIGDPREIERLRTTLRAQGPPPPERVERAATTAIERTRVAVPLERGPGGVGAQPFEQRARTGEGADAARREQNPAATRDAQREDVNRQRPSAPVGNARTEGERTQQPVAPEHEERQAATPAARDRNRSGDEPGTSPAGSPRRHEDATEDRTTKAGQTPRAAREEETPRAARQEETPRARQEETPRTRQEETPRAKSDSESNRAPQQSAAPRREDQSNTPSDSDRKANAAPSATGTSDRHESERSNTKETEERPRKTEPAQSDSGEKAKPSPKP